MTVKELQEALASIPDDYEIVCVNRNDIISFPKQVDHCDYEQEVYIKDYANDEKE